MIHAAWNAACYYFVEIYQQGIIDNSCLVSVDYICLCLTNAAVR